MQRPSACNMKFYNNAATMHKHRNKVSQFLVPSNDALILRPSRFYPTPAPLVLDEDANRMTDSAFLTGSSVVVYFHLYAAFYQEELHFKTKMLLAQRLPDDPEMPV